MKKLFLLSMAAALSVSAFAQSGGRSIVLDGGTHVDYGTPYSGAKTAPMANPSKELNHSFSNVGAKKTSPDPRFYSYFYFIDQILGNPFTGSGNLTVLQPIWFDSTVLQRFSTGYHTINYISAANTIDPTADEFNSDTDLVNTVYGLTSGAGNLMKVTTADDYSVDSIYVAGTYYLAKPTRTTWDSLIISVVPSGNYYYWPKATTGWVANYTSDDTLRGYAPTFVDSIRRMALSNSTTDLGKSWVVGLDPATMGDAPDPSTGSVNVRTFRWAPPGGSVHIPAGHTFTISVTFKSTDSWTPNVDSVYEFNRFMPYWGFENPSPGGYMTYQRNTYKNDRNMGDLMFWDDSSQYLPVLPIQGFNLPGSKFFLYEYAAMSAQVSCPTCKTITTPVSVNNVVGTIAGVNAYPNPADGNVNISYKLSQASDVTVTLSNTIGQVLKTQNMGNTLSGQAVINTSNLAEGVYFYTVLANGERSTGRVVVSH